MNYLPTCTSRLVVQHPCQVSFKSMQGCRRSWEDKLWCDGMTEWRKDGRTDKANTKCPLAILWRGHKKKNKEKTIQQQKGLPTLSADINNTSSQMLLDHCYAFSMLLKPSGLKKKGNPPDLFWPRPGSTPGWFCPRVNTNVRGHEYFIPTKFGKYPSSNSVVKANYVFQYIDMH